MITYWQAIWLAILQGLTEFLPVSSSGHLAIAGMLFHINTDVGPLFDVLLHVGTLIAVCAVYYKDVWVLIREVVLLVVDGIRYLVNRTKNPFRMYRERLLALYVILASIPTAVIGLLVQKFLEDLFLSSLTAVGCALLITAAILFLSKKIPAGTKNLEDMKIRDVLTIGTVQGFATIPGISRSGSTIVTEFAAGLNPEFAVEFSFLISLPAIAGAALLNLLDAGLDSFAVNAGPYLVGVLLAALTGYLCIRFLLRILKKGKFYYFGYYCAAIGLVAVIAGFFI
jgi:undecaprenyl-diphosphatase